MKLKNSTGRPYFWQWDLNQKLIVEDDCTCKEVHFCNRASKTSLVCLIEEVDGERIANVPNILLQTDGVITAYLCSRTDNGGETRLSRTFQVRPRTKPESYVYTEAEVLNYHSLADRIDQIEKNGISDEKIGQAVAGYLDEHGIETGATAEEAAQIQQNKADIEQLTQTKLDADALPEAINEALAQAKASGEFKGDPGEPGTVTDEQIASAVEDYMAEHPIVPDSSQNATVYIGSDQPTDGTLYWLDTSGDGDETEPVVYSVTANLTNVTTDNTAKTVNEGNSYAAAITAADGYVLSAVSVTMGGVDITGTNYADGNIFIASVTGNIVITATAVEVSVTTYTITNSLVNVATDNSAVSVEENSAYTATLTVADGYDLESVTVTMGGVDVTNDVYADGVITIEAVTGDVVITATTVKQSEYNTAVAVVDTNITGNLYEDDGETVITSSLSSKRITSEAFDSDTEVEITLYMTSTSYGGMYVQSYDAENAKFYRREGFPKNGDQYFTSGKSYTYVYTIKAGCKLSFTVTNNNYTMFDITVMRKG